MNDFDFDKDYEHLVQREEYRKFVRNTMRVGNLLYLLFWGGIAWLVYVLLTWL